MPRNFAAPWPVSTLDLSLAILLARYEMDEPHVDEPDGSGHYPEITPETFAGWLAGPHQGDCVDLPAPCVRCFAEAIRHKADWVAARLTTGAATDAQ